MTERDKRVVIATGGSWSPDDHHLIMDTDFVIGVDAGNVALLKRNVPIDLAVGDFDTTTPEQLDALLAKGVRVEYLPAEKDVTDTDFAVTKALEQNPTEVLILGAWGSRWDHTLANVTSLERLLRAGVRGVMQNRWNRMQLVPPGQLKVKKQNYTYFSLVPWSDTVTGIFLSGFKYPLANATLKRTSHLGISNEWIEETGTVSHEEGELLVIQSRDPSHSDIKARNGNDLV